MPTDLYDAVDWNNLLGKAGAKVGYADGPVSAWPAQAWTEVPDVIPFRITVLADPQYPLFDSETGNAGTDKVAEAVASRLDAGEWSGCYTNEDNFGGLTSSLRRKSIGWTDASHWPAKGCYLWAADPGIPPGTVPAWCPVTPIAVQDRAEGGFDISTCFGAFPESTSPAPEPAPSPQPTPEPAPAPSTQECTVQLPVLQQGSIGPSVKVIQQLLGGLTDDGVFGPLTHQRVTAYQGGLGLVTDGIVGTHTWGHLLGAPQ